MTGDITIIILYFLLSDTRNAKRLSTKSELYEFINLQQLNSDEFRN